MGKTLVDLPDPENMSSPPGDNADDLLSQMAGAEIDRLLAEADVDSDPEPSAAPISTPFDAAPLPAAPTPPAAPPAAAPAPPPAESSVPVREPAPAQKAPDIDPPSPADEILDSFVTADISPDDADLAPGSNAITDIAGDGSDIIDKTISDSPRSAPEPVMPAAPMRAEPTRPEPATAATQPIIPDHPPAAALTPSSAPRSEPVIDDTDPDAPPSAARLLAEELDSPSLVRVLSNVGQDADLLPPTDAKIPLLLTPLVWINAPFAGLPESTRTVVGKIALWTLLHATAILIYVLFIRK